MDYVRYTRTTIFENQSDQKKVMVAETVSLGVLSLPAAIASMGLVPLVKLS